MHTEQSPSCILLLWNNNNNVITPLQPPKGLNITQGIQKKEKETEKLGCNNACKQKKATNTLDGNAQTNNLEHMLLGCYRKTVKNKTGNIIFVKVCFTNSSKKMFEYCLLYSLYLRLRRKCYCGPTKKKT